MIFDHIFDNVHPPVKLFNSKVLAKFSFKSSKEIYFDDPKIIQTSYNYN